MYEQIARFYDLTHDALTEDVEFILKLAAAQNGPVLELGCGTGRLLLPLARAGQRVVGVDNAEAMLQRARSRLKTLPTALAAKVTLQSADITELSAPAEGKFGLVLLPYNTAMHLDTAAMGRVLPRVRELLGENGHFFIDVANPFLVAATPNDRMVTLENVLTDHESGNIVTQMASNWLDEEAQTLHITWLYDESPAAGGLVERTVVQVDYHYLFPHQWQLLVADNGLRIDSILGNYDHTTFAEESPRLLLILKRD